MINKEIMNRMNEKKLSQLSGNFVHKGIPAGNLLPLRNPALD
jgi:hypothetical protein